MNPPKLVLEALRELDEGIVRVIVRPLDGRVDVRLIVETAGPGYEGRVWGPEDVDQIVPRLYWGAVVVEYGLEKRPLGPAPSAGLLTPGVGAAATAAPAPPPEPEPEPEEEPEEDTDEEDTDEEEG